MEIKRCENGHFYDPEVNSTCPECAAEMRGGISMNTMFGSDFEDYGKTEPADDNAGQFETSSAPYQSPGNNNAGQFEDYGVTMPSGGFDSDNQRGGFDNGSQRGSFDNIGTTVPSGGFDGGSQDTRPGNSFGPTEGFPNPGFQPVEIYDSVTEVAGMIGGKGSLKPGKKFSPAAGWLACTAGPAKGMDYRIRCGYNYIGRSEHMDICIRGDNTISREKHAVIAYDNKERIFFFSPADGKSIVRVNDKMIMGPTEIHAFDTLQIGDTELLFVPLCGERFNWNE